MPFSFFRDFHENYIATQILSSWQIRRLQKIFYLYFLRKSTADKTGRAAASSKDPGIVENT
jgi:hypothetical protein